MPSEKAMVKAAKIIKAPVAEKSTKNAADPDDETSSSGTSNPGSDDDDATSSNGSGSGSGSGSDSDSEEGDEEEEEDLPQHVTAPTPSKKVHNNASNQPTRPSTKAVAAPGAPFVPPKGFEPLKADSEPKASKLLSQSKLAGKQIWYITAPSSLPITSIKSVALKDVQKGKPVATINGQSYGFQKDEGPEKDNTKLLVPSREGGRYETSNRGIDQVLHLQQIVDLPELMTEERATIPAASKFVRQQPKGLRMRFKPIGFGDEDTGKIGETDNEDSDVDMDDAPRVFKKHKVSAESGDEALKKSKKDKEKKKDKKEKKERKEKKSKA